MENNNVDTTKTINHLSLCLGYEGIGIGLRRVLPNLREIAYVEREGFPVANLVAKMEAGELDTAPVFTDVKTFPYGKFRGCVDILSGGFPCQPFSSAGKRNGVEDPRHLFPYIADGIRECQPRIVFLENVEGIISAKTADGESVLQYVLRELEGLGYRATAGVFSAAEVGAPHQRKRVFILGYSQHNGCAAQQELRGDEEASDQWRKEESSKTSESEGASRPIDVPSIQGCTEGGKSAELGNAADVRLKQYRADTREVSSDQSGEERRVYEPQGASALSRDGSQQEGGEELANPHSSKSSKGRGDNGEVPEVSSVKRADLGSSLPRGEGDQRNSELANSNHEGLEGHQLHSSSEQGEPIQADTWSAGSTRWPSRPSEPQHEWEEPRVVGNTQNINCDVSNDNGELGQSECRKPRGAAGETVNWGQAESRLGRASNGSANRVDRLRLLGNGVVPATAAKAFVTLINRIYKHD